MRFTEFWSKSWTFVRLGIMRRVREYGVKIFFTLWVLLTIMLIYLVDKRPENDFAIVYEACPQGSTVEARAEHIYWGNVSKLVFICKE